MTATIHQLSHSSEEVPFHPLADLFPLIKGPEFDALVQSIKENGQLEPIVLLDGAILDGRNRYRACAIAGVQPQFTTPHILDPKRYVIARNIDRRHLNETQRAAIAAEIATMPAGYRTDLKPSRLNAEVSLKEAAELLNVSRSHVNDAKQVIKRGSEEERSLLRSGTLAVRTTANAIRQGMSPEERKASRQVPKNKSRQRQETLQAKANLWHKLRDSLDNLASLPLPADVVPIASLYDVRTGNGGIVNKRLRSTIEWLQEFEHAWNTRND